jgi:folate-binding protein YgfZ
MSDAVTVELDAQYRQLREECGLLERKGRGKLILRGVDAAEYLEGQLTNEVEALEAGEGCYAALLDRKGHVQADMRVLRLAADEVWLDTEPEGLGAARRHLQMYKIGHQVEIEDLTGDRSIFSLLGPRSAEIAATPPLPEFASLQTTVANVDCLAVGARAGLDLIVATAAADRLCAALIDAGAAEVGPEAAEILRVEAGVPRFGAEIGTETMPAEVGIVSVAVSFSKGCYIGQEPVARLHYKGRPNRHLRGLTLSAPAEPGAVLRQGEKEVGRIGTACVSPAHGPIALAVVRREAQPGDELSVGEDGVTAQVTDLPFG